MKRVGWGDSQTSVSRKPCLAAHFGVRFLGLAAVPLRKLDLEILTESAELEGDDA